MFTAGIQNENSYKLPDKREKFLICPETQKNIYKILKNDLNRWIMISLNTIPCIR